MGISKFFLPAIVSNLIRARNSLVGPELNILFLGDQDVRVTSHDLSKHYPIP